MLTPSASAEVRNLGVGERLAGGLEREFEHPGGRVVQIGGVLFDNRAAAQSFFQVMAIDYSALQEVEGGIEPARPLTHVRLGEESLGIKGSLAPSMPRKTVVVLVWRVRNLVLFVRGFGVAGIPGSADEVLARRLADAVDSEAA